MQVCYAYVGPMAWWAAMSAEAQAAWATFFGTMVALVVAVVAPMIHSRIFERRRVRAEVRAIAELAEHAYEVVAFAKDSVADSKSYMNYMAREYPTSDFSSPVTLLRNIPLQSTLDHRVARPVLELANAIEAFDRATNQIYQSFRLRGDANPGDVEEALFIAEGSATNATNAIEVLRRVAADYH